MRATRHPVATFQNQIWVSCEPKILISDLIFSLHRLYDLKTKCSFYFLLILWLDFPVNVYQVVSCPQLVKELPWMKSVLFAILFITGKILPCTIWLWETKTTPPANPDYIDYIKLNVVDLWRNTVTKCRGHGITWCVDPWILRSKYGLAIAVLDNIRFNGILFLEFHYYSQGKSNNYRTFFFSVFWG